MARNALLVILFLFLIVFGGSDASFGWELRRLVGADPKSNKTAKGMHDSPSPTSDPKPMDESGQKKTDSPSTSTAQKGDPVSSNTNISPVPPPVTKSDDGKSHGQEIKKDDQTFSQSNTNENCDDLNKCRVDGDVVACISKSDSKYLVVIVQNGGDSVAQVNLSMGSSNIGSIEVAKHKNKKINISVTIDRSTELTLNAGKGDCVLHMATIVPEGGIFLHLPSYEKILTPVNGAYFLILAVLILGTTWACCKFRKKRHDGVPYQELEMALPESVSATNVEVAEVWDQDWDDNWDEEVAVKSPGRTHAGSISANGLTARSSNRDGWGNDWDD